VSRDDATLVVVVIGRNEGPRLPDCLRSVKAARAPVIYVDSGSRDRSVAIAKEHGVRVLELDPARPFSAARARNEGFELARSMFPHLECVQFLDGDCMLDAAWLSRGRTALEEDPTRAVVIGHLREQGPEQGRYKRLCALEWKSAAGDIVKFGNLGGIMLVRVWMFSAVRGFNPEVIAGEDSELGVRLHAAGFKLTKLDAPMASHEADIRRFGQWWRRAVRSGHAIGQRSALHGRSPSRDCVRERRSTLCWGVALPVLTLLLAWPTHGLSLLLLAAYGALAWRVFRFRRLHGDEPADARLYATFNVIGKFAEAVGLLKYAVSRAAGQFRIIEYK
jgi:GT2 family glycosyltransferase